MVRDMDLATSDRDSRKKMTVTKLNLSIDSLVIKLNICKAIRD